MNKETLNLIAGENLNSYNSFGPQAPAGLTVGIFFTPFHGEEILVAKTLAWNDEKSIFRSFAEAEQKLDQTGIFFTTSSLDPKLHAIASPFCTSTTESSITAITQFLQNNNFFEVTNQ